MRASSLVVCRWLEPLEYRDILLLLVEEAGVIRVTRQCADFGAAEDAVAVTGDGVVGRVAEEFGQESQEGCGWTPWASELVEDEEGGVGAGEQRFVGEFMVEDDVDRVELGGIDAVAGEDAGGEWALQRGETEDGVVIATENELDEAVAESADAVVEKDGMGHGAVPCEVWTRMGLGYAGPVALGHQLKHSAAAALMAPAATLGGAAVEVALGVADQRTKRVFAICTACEIEEHGFLAILIHLEECSATHEWRVLAGSCPAVSSGAIKITVRVENQSRRCVIAIRTSQETV